MAGRRWTSWQGADAPLPPPKVRPPATHNCPLVMARAASAVNSGSRGTGPPPATNVPPQVPSLCLCLSLPRAWESWHPGAGSSWPRRTPQALRGDGSGPHLLRERWWLGGQGSGGRGRAREGKWGWGATRAWMAVGLWSRRKRGFLQMCKAPRSQPTPRLRGTISPVAPDQQGTTCPAGGDHARGRDRSLLFQGTQLHPVGSLVLGPTKWGCRPLPSQEA